MTDILNTDRQVDGDPDAAVLTALEFRRSWAMFRFPRLLMVLERIQAEVFRRRGLRPGNYGKFAVDLENGFNAPELVGLDEYGLPIQLGQKLRQRLRLGKGLDAAIASLRTLDAEHSGLSSFERTIVERVQGGL